MGTDEAVNCNSSTIHPNTTFLQSLTFKNFLIGSKIFPHCLNILFILLWLTLVYNAMIIGCLKYSYYKSTFNIQGWIKYHVYIRFSPLEPTIMQYSTFMNFMKLPNNDLKIIDTFHISILHYIRKKNTLCHPPNGKPQYHPVWSPGNSPFKLKVQFNIPHNPPPIFRNTQYL